ncbi:12894_t:CDS:2, partial [Acaulospora colombiana]
FVYIDEVLKIAESGVTRELPGNYPYAVKKHYALRFTKDWDGPARRLFTRLENIFKAELKKLVQQHSSRFSAGGLHYKVLQRTMEKLQECIALEQEEPMTSNEHYLEDYKAKYMARYKAVLRTHTQHEGELQKFMEGKFQGSEMMQTTLQNLQAMGLPANEDALMRLLPPNPIDNALQIMAEFAFKRFVDYVPMIIDYELFKGFERTMNNAFVKGLELGESQLRERFAAYLEQDPELVERRETLKRDYSRFESALEDLQNIPGFSLSSDNSDDLVYFLQAHTRTILSNAFESDHLRLTFLTQLSGAQSLVSTPTFNVVGNYLDDLSIVNAFRAHQLVLVVWYNDITANNFTNIPLSMVVHDSRVRNESHKAEGRIGVHLGVDLKQLQKRVFLSYNQGAWEVHSSGRVSA